MTSGAAIDIIATEVATSAAAEGSLAFVAGWNQLSSAFAAPPNGTFVSAEPCLSTFPSRHIWASFLLFVRTLGPLCLATSAMGSSIIPPSLEVSNPFQGSMARKRSHNMSTEYGWSGVVDGDDHIVGELTE